MSKRLITPLGAAALPPRIRRELPLSRPSACRTAALPVSCSSMETGRGRSALHEKHVYMLLTSSYPSYFFKKKKKPKKGSDVWERLRCSVGLRFLVKMFGSVNPFQIMRKGVPRPTFPLRLPHPCYFSWAMDGSNWFFKFLFKNSVWS